MQLEQSYFKSEQDSEVLLPATESGDGATDSLSPRAELVAMNDIQPNSHPAFATAENGNKPLDALLPNSSTVLWRRFWGEISRFFRFLSRFFQFSGLSSLPVRTYVF